MRPRPWIRGWTSRRARALREIDDEIEAHLAARVDHLVRTGLSPEAARAEARRRFGDIEGARTALRRHVLRPRAPFHPGAWLEILRQDLSYVARGLARSPAFTAGVVVTLGLGFGINAAVFRVADQVLRRPPAGVTGAHGVRAVTSTVVFGRGEPQLATVFSYPDAEALVASGAFDMAAMHTGPRVSPGPDGRDVAIAAVDAAYFPLLGVTPRAGRLFDVREGTPGAGVAVAVVSHAYLERHMGGVLSDGAAVRVGSREYAVVGVAAPGFTGIDADPVDIWIPLGAADLGRGVVNGVAIPWHRLDQLRALRVIGRPGRGVPDGPVAERLGATLAAVDRAANRPERAAQVHPIVPVGLAARDRAPHRVLGRLSIVAAVVLLIAGANAVNLLLARGLRRHHEVAIRLALGASRARIVRLLVAESLMLALVGAAAAVVAGAWTADGLRRLVFPDARWVATAFDPRTFVFVAGLALAAGLVAGLAPALQSTNPDLVSGLKGDRRRGGARTRATRGGLIVAQSALSLVLLVASGLLVRSLVQLNRVDLGFDPAGLVTATLPSASLLRGAPPADIEGLADALTARVLASGLADAVALASVAPFGATAMTDIRVPGSAFVPDSDRDLPLISAVSRNYFAVMRTAVLAGRSLDARPPGDAELVAVVNSSMARRYWPDGIPDGACILPAGRPCARVIGVVDDVRDSPGGAPAPMRFYLPLEMEGRPPGAIIARTDAARAPTLAALLRDSTPAGARLTTEVVPDRIARTLRPWRTATLLFLGLGAVALALSSVGVYSVLNYVASERVRELGVRAVLGATSRDLRRLVLAEGLRWTPAGCAIGLLAAAASGRALEGLLFDVSSLDLAVFGAAAATVLAAAIVAMEAPARRAAGVSPLVALRLE